MQGTMQIDIMASYSHCPISNSPFPNLIVCYVILFPWLYGTILLRFNFLPHQVNFASTNPWVPSSRAEPAANAVHPVARGGGQPRNNGGRGPHRGGRGRGHRGRGRGQHGGAYGGPHLAGYGGPHVAGYGQQVPVQQGWPPGPRGQSILGVPGFPSAENTFQSPPPVVCQLCFSPGHSALNCARFTNNSAPALAAFPTGESNESVWYPDSGASAHMTPHEGQSHGSHSTPGLQ
ncbi:unnamed protein product [Cuscuta epithymum]|uniref:Uncharacterized protein n=1 Tax=Cuscuta epithymum TaxID=186058 RepID=A0AAV0CVL1_9ASTE|nr:unnamed protein product [Cuscuta epithymum]CAH9142270.1 unnamed protein product [Cuscuta epithymum]